MKCTLRLLLWKHDPNQYNQLPIYLKISAGGKVTYASTHRFIDSKQWDEKNQMVRSSNPLSKLINLEITAKRNKIYNKVVQLELENKTATVYELKQYLNESIDHHNFFDFADGFYESVKNKRSKGTLKNYRRHIYKIELFNGSRELALENITTDFLQRFENWLHGYIKSRKQTSNYIHTIWKTFKTFFNEARRRGIVKHYPFENYENPIYVVPDKDVLNRDELYSWEKYADCTEEKYLKQTAVFFLFGCYSGLRISDWRNFSFEKHIINDGQRLRLRPQKTQKRNQWVELKINKPLARNLNRMAQIKYTMTEPAINRNLKIIANALGINKDITSHSARHTFAVTVCLNNKVSSETAAELMGITLKTFVENYSQVTQSKIDSETDVAWRNLD